MENVKAVLDVLMELAKAKRSNEAFAYLVENFDAIKEYIMFLGENQIIGIDELNDLSNNLMDAVENKDLFLLTDVVQYALISVYDQLFKEDEANEEE
ncbi:MAG: hypothetical protein J5876_03340 [Lachnospiraceae bacterium]|nr:hypothetical protein [Lachnospiraceae bacterium]